jgi:pimeloyl-ACP methyl ester carboxylesterase
MHKKITLVIVFILTQNNLTLCGDHQTQGRQISADMRTDIDKEQQKNAQREEKWKKDVTRDADKCVAELMKQKVNKRSHKIEQIVNPKAHLVIVPGKNGGGGGNIDIVLPHYKYSKYQHTARIPAEWPYQDLGQHYCISDLNKTMQGLKRFENAKKFILYGASQGGATALDYAAQNPDEVAALILEGPLVNANSAIVHFAKHLPHCPPFGWQHPKIAALVAQLACRPAAHYLFPYLSWPIHPFYSPTGKQALFNCATIPKNIPIILMHCETDPQVPFEDTQALYTALWNEKYDVYLLPMKANDVGMDHIDLIQEDDKEIDVIHTILKKHNLLPHEKNETIVDLTPYRPLPQPQWYQHLNNLKIRNDSLWCLDKSCKIVLCSLLMWFLHRAGIITSIMEKVQSKN